MVVVGLVGGNGVDFTASLLASAPLILATACFNAVLGGAPGVGFFILVGAVGFAKGSGIFGLTGAEG